MLKLLKWIFKDKYSSLKEYRKKNPINLPAIDSSLRGLIEQNKNNGFHQVTMYNDDVTPMEFVIEVLEHYLSYSVSEAAQKMAQIHKLGSAGIYTSNEEVATRVCTLINDAAKIHGHSLTCSVQST